MSVDWAELVREALAARLSADFSGGDLAVDDELWRVWQASELDVPD